MTTASASPRSASDTRLRLYDGAGVVLEDGDDIAGPSNRCSFIDGTAGTTATSTGNTDSKARNLAPGFYRLRVSHFSDFPVGTVGTYFLEVQLVQE